MAERIIDLRNRESATDPVPPGVPKFDELAYAPSPLPKHTQELLEWSALEYEKRERSPNWFLLPGAAALGLVILGIFTQSYFFIAFVVLAFITLLLFVRRSPPRTSFTVTGEGIRAGSNLYQFSDLKSFWIFNRPDFQELSLETKKTLSPFVRLPLGNLDPETVREVLARFLPEEEHKEFASDQIARSLGL